MRLSIALCLRLLKVHQARKSRPPELPIRDGVVRPAILPAALQFIIAARRHVRRQRRRVIRPRFDEHHLQIRSREPKSHARRLKREKSAQDAVHQELRPEVQRRSREQRDAEQHAADAVVPRHDHDVVIERRRARRDARARARRRPRSVRFDFDRSPNANRRAFERHRVARARAAPRSTRARVRGRARARECGRAAHGSLADARCAARCAARSVGRRQTATRDRRDMASRGAAMARAALGVVDANANACARARDDGAGDRAAKRAAGRDDGGAGRLNSNSSATKRRRSDAGRRADDARDAREEDERTRASVRGERGRAGDDGGGGGGE